MIELNKIHNEDCLEGMRKIPDGSIDMILCDLPYGTVKNMVIDGWKNKGESCTWDNKLDIEKLFIEYERVCRENANIILFLDMLGLEEGWYKFAYPLFEKDHFAKCLNTKSRIKLFEDLSFL